MLSNPETWREHARRCAELATKANTRELKVHLAQRAKHFLKVSIELERNLALRCRTTLSSAPQALHRMGVERLEEADENVAEAERLVDGWRELVEQMQARRSDVTIARDLLETFERDLKARRTSRDLIQRLVEGEQKILPH